MFESVNRINWELFAIQKHALLCLLDDPKTTQEVMDALSGVVNLMDAIQDDFKPKAEEQHENQYENQYECPCGEVWYDCADSECDDRCPECNTSCSPSNSVEIEA